MGCSGKLTASRRKVSKIHLLIISVALWVGKEEPELYTNTIEHLGLYSSMQLKNGSDVMKCLKSEKLEKPEASANRESYCLQDKSMRLLNGRDYED